MNEPKIKPKILCVDDDEAVLSAVQRVLREDFDVLVVESGEEARQVLAEHRDIAIVLSDQKMRNETGLELLRHVRVASPDSVRALLTAYVELTDLVDAVNTGLVHRLILKPWENELLRVQMVESLLIHGTLREKRELERLAITDPVTQLRNHRYFQDHLRIEIERATRHSRHLSLVMIDIDHFKNFNDQFGHPAGDTLLRAIASRLTQGLRTIDTVARYGGEEFALILPDTDTEAAKLVAERVRLSFETEPFTSPDGRPTFVTLSLGFATVPDDATTAAQLIQLADSALYRAKRQGRNQSVGASSRSLLD